MVLRTSLVATCLLAAAQALAADPIRIGVTTILSGPMADRGQSEQYGVELALQRINQAGGVLGRPVEAIYGDNAADVATGVAATKRLIEEEHVPVIIGALATPVTHAIMPLVKDAKIPLVIDISAGQDFVDASGVGGNDYVFKTIPSDLDIARGLMQWLKGQSVHSVVILADDNPFNLANAKSLQTSAAEAGITVLANETVAKGTTDLSSTLERFKQLKPDRIVTVLSGSSPAFFRAYEKVGGGIALAGRLDYAAALATLSPQFLSSGGLADAASITVFNPFIESAGVRDFIQAYRSKFGVTPTQRSFFAFEATNLVADAVRRSGSDSPEAIRQALKSSKMPSLLGGSYAMDEHNHPHTPMQIVGVRDGKPKVIAAVGG